MIKLLDIYKNHIRDIWRVETKDNYVEVKSVYPQSGEAYAAFNTLVGYCAGRGMKVRDYDTTDDLLYAMRGPIRELHSIISKK